MGNRSCERGMIAQMQVPIVRAGNAELVAIHVYAEQGDNLAEIRGIVT